MKCLFTPCLLCITSILLSGCRNYYDLTASFTNQHIHENKGKVVVQIPDAYELGFVLLSLTDTCRKDSNLVDYTTAYAKAVTDWFKSFEKHEAVVRINQLVTANHTPYRYFKDGMFAYQIVDKHLVQKADYHVDESRVEFESLLPLTNDFITKTGFDRFYTQQLPFYKQVIRYEEKPVHIQHMWQRLETHYATRLQSYQVIISPLVNGYHNTLVAGSAPYQEALMFVSGADEKDLAQPDDTLRISALERIVFTEIDHNYVNPVTEQERTKVNQLNWRKWNTSDDDYKNGFRTFNEYMTWALYLAYAKEIYPSTVYEKISIRETHQLEALRGFIRFREFMAELLRRKNERPTASYSSLQHSMMSWMLAN